MSNFSGICLDGPKIWESFAYPEPAFRAPVRTDPMLVWSVNPDEGLEYPHHDTVEYRHFLYTGVGFWTCNQQIEFLPVAPWTTNAMPAFNVIRDHFPHLEKLARLITDLQMYRMTTPECIDKVVGLHPELSPMKDMAMELGIYEASNEGKRSS